MITWKQILKWIKRRVRWFFYVGRLNKIRLEPIDSPRFILFMVPEYGNLGDQAIAQAQYIFLEEHFPGQKIVEVPFRYFFVMKRFFKRRIKQRDIICIVGGGNMGTIWFDFELERREIIKSFPNNKIISFPQSVFYTEDQLGYSEYVKSIKIYSAHKNLHLFARDWYSFEILEKAYAKNVYLAPDMALYFDKTIPNIKRDGVLMCFRNDKEKNISETFIESIESIARRYTDNIVYTDTAIKENILISQRENILNQKYEQFRMSKLVFTDRLHGMIFAAITGTPCIAFGNNYHKIKGIYEWIKHLPYIKYTVDITNVESYTEELWNMNECKYDNSCYIGAFERIYKVCKDQ